VEFTFTKLAMTRKLINL